jgi:hypothetical protein
VKEYCRFRGELCVAEEGTRGREVGAGAATGTESEIRRQLLEEIAARNRRLPDFKRVGGYMIWEKIFPRTASMKIKRQVLAEDIGKSVARETMVEL